MVVRNYLAFACSVLMVCSCGDPYEAGETPMLTQNPYTVLNSATGDENVDLEKPFVYAEQGATLKFYSGLSANGHVVPVNQISNYASKMLWEIEGKRYESPVPSHTFEEAGHKKGSLETIDLYGDTLRTDFDIYVNEPNFIDVEFPYDGYNQADPGSNQSLPLRWKMGGIDEWESAYCYVYLSNDLANLWQSNLGKVDCKKQVSIVGSLVGMYDLTDGERKTILKDSSITVYWAVVLEVGSELGKMYRDTSDIAHFTTRILDNDSSTIKIPVKHRNFRTNTLTNLEVVFVAANGDTRDVVESSEIHTTISAKFKPQMGIHIFINEKLRKEYGSEQMVVDLPPNTVLSLDTVYLKDSIPPQIMLNNDKVAFGERVSFLIYDNGSGVNSEKLGVVIDNDTLSVTYVTPNLKFTPKCSILCKVRIYGDDYEKNPLPHIYWNMSRKTDHFYLTGPFYDEE